MVVNGFGIDEMAVNIWHSLHHGSRHNEAEDSHECTTYRIGLPLWFIYVLVILKRLLT